MINIVFDNVHFARDNPNVPSDLEQMPHLLNFLKHNGTVLLEHAHAADRPYRGRQPVDLHGPVRRPPRPARVEHATRRTTPTGRPTRRPRSRTGRRRSSTPRRPPTAGHDTTPSMVYSDHVPATIGDTSKTTPAPWVPFTRAGCTVGDFSTANMVLENAAGDLPTVFGADLARGRAVQRRPGLVQGRRDRRLHRRGGPLREGRRDSARTPRR